MGTTIASDRTLARGWLFSYTGWVRRVCLAPVVFAACTSPDEAATTLRAASDEVATPANQSAAGTDTMRAQGHRKAAALRSPIKVDEEVILFPTAAWLDQDAGLWRVPLRGWIYEPEVEDVARRALVAGLRELVGDDSRLGSEIFESRIRPFVRDNERGKEIAVAIGPIVAVAGPSGPNGHFTGAAEIQVDVALRLAAQRTGREPPPLLRLETMTRPEDRRQFEVDAFLVPPTGLTVISDIDDTVKITEVTDKKKLLRNTFFEPFRAVPGMAATYGRWLREAQSGHLHFVSSSPWQLYPALSRMLQTAGFPPATFDLKQISLADGSVAELFSDPIKTKRGPIERVLESFPRRRFVLVGDSGEKDPEIYGEVARAHPGKVVYIAIRNVTGQAADDPRYAAAFRDVTARWQVFEDPAELSGPGQPVRAR